MGIKIPNFTNEQNTGSLNLRQALTRELGHNAFEVNLSGINLKNHAFVLCHHLNTSIRSNHLKVSVQLKTFSATVEWNLVYDYSVLTCLISAPLSKSLCMYVQIRWQLFSCITRLSGGKGVSVSISTH